MKPLPAFTNNHFMYAVALLFCLLLHTKAGAQIADTTTQASPSKIKRVFYGQSSYYANKFQGRKTASGEIFDQKKLTCACNVLPLGTWIRVTNLRNGRTIVVKTNDRLHPRMHRIIDLTKAAATKLAFVSSGVTRVKIEVIGKKQP